MRRKLFYFLLLLFFFLQAQTNIYAQSSKKRKRLRVKIGYVMPRHKTSVFNAVTATQYYDEIKPGVGFGLDVVLFAKNKSELSLGLNLARLKYAVTQQILVSNRTQSDDIDVTWFHMPLDYRIQFISRSEKHSVGVYFGCGVSFLRVSSAVGHAAFGFSAPSFNATAVGYHLNLGCELGDGGFEIEWSDAKKDGVQLGALSLYGTYRF